MMRTLSLFVLENSEQARLLRQQAVRVEFPLSVEDRELIEAMKAMVKSGVKEKNDAAGLAAPQVGVSRQIIVYHVEEAWRAWRADLEAAVPLTVLINPAYAPLEEEGKSLDWEGCFSVESQVGKVYRYTAIHYTGQDEEGRPVEGVARGFLARLLQHEIDHVRGTLIVDRFDPDSPHGAPEAMKQLRQKEKEALQAEGRRGASAE